MSDRRLVEVTAQLAASVVRVEAAAGDSVAEGDVLLVVETMKMEIPVTAPLPGIVVGIDIDIGDIISEGDLLAVIDVSRSGGSRPQGG